jgi:hypothetical protein
LYVKGFYVSQKNKKRLTEEEDMAKRFLVLIALLMLGFFIAGCAEGDKSSNVSNPNPDVFAPTGSISGVVFNPCTNAVVKGAVVSVAYAGGVHQVTTAANGGFGFNNVPANDSWDDGYIITCDLTKVTGYGYAVLSCPVYVEYSDLGDGTNNDLEREVTEAAPGTSTPVNKLATSYTFNVSALTSSISGTIFDVSTGLVGTAATVQLYWNGNFVATTTASAAGVFSFTGIMASEDYSLMVTKTGYDVVDGEKISLGEEGYGGSCGFLAVTCPVPCNGALTDVKVDLAFNPDKDITPPYITSIVVPGGPSAADGGSIWGDVIDYSATTVTPFAALVVNFSEAMNTLHTTRNAFQLDSEYAVTLTSAGTNGQTVSLSDVNIIKSWALTWNSAGTSFILAPTFYSAVELAGTDHGGAWAGGTVAYNYGYMHLGISHGYSSIMLTDLALNPWNPTLDLDTPGFEYQYYYIVPERGMFHNWFWIGQGNTRADFWDLNDGGYGG